MPLQPQRVRMVGTGLHPTADVPESRRKGKDAAPVYLPCASCAQPVVIGEMQDGTVVILDANAINGLEVQSEFLRCSLPTPNRA